MSIKLGHRGAKSGRRHTLAKKICSQKIEKESPKKIQKVLMEIDEMADVFLNSDNFAQQAFLTLVPCSGYNLNLKALNKMSKVS